MVGVDNDGLTLWQLKQFSVVGMWLPGFGVAEPPAVWQLAQLVASLKPAWSTLAPAQPVVWWQLSQLVTPECTGVFGLPAALR